MTVMLLYFALLLIAMSLMGIVTGSLVHAIIHKKAAVTLLYSIVGVLLVQLVLFIPIAGPIVFSGLLLVTLGSVCERFFASLRSQ